MPVEIVHDESLVEAAAPAQRWRNRYWFYRYVLGFWTDVARSYEPGEFRSPYVYPSQEIAEQRARDFLDEMNSDAVLAQWLGAFPE